MSEDQEALEVADRLSQLGLKIREARKLRSLTLTELAGRVGLTASHISQIERGLTSPSVSCLLGIAGALDLPMEYFFANGTDSAGPVASAPSVARAHTMLAMRGGAVNDGALDLERNRLSARDTAPVVLPDERETINIIGGIQWQRLTPTNEEAVEFLELHYPPGASSGDLAYAHRGREFGRVLQGTLLVELGFAKYTLREGDAIAFDCSIPHRFTNIGDDLFIGIWVILDRS
jgi:transcriptional regulator with XRE-family HTH domain/mannose-6-phosphate isomerase-like protein (cupin superfamily)